MMCEESDEVTSMNIPGLTKELLALLMRVYEMKQEAEKDPDQELFFEQHEILSLERLEETGLILFTRPENDARTWVKVVNLTQIGMKIVSAQLRTRDSDVGGE